MSATDELLDTLRGPIPDWVIDDHNDVALFKAMHVLSRGQQLVARLWLALDGHTHLSPTAVELVQYLDFDTRAKAFAAMSEGIRRAPERTCSLEQHEHRPECDELGAACRICYPATNAS